MKTAVRQLTFSLTEGGPHYFDLAQCLSLVNRRAYRQGYLYAVDSFAWNPTAPGAGVDIQSLPTSWPMYNSWVKARALYNRMNRQTGVRVPKWHDFKCFFDTVHYAGMSANAYVTNEIPVDGNNVVYDFAGAEWVYSQVVIPNLGGSLPAKEAALHMLGDELIAVNAAIGTDQSNAVIQGYADTRVTVGLHEPDLPGDASSNWMTLIDDPGDVDADIINHLESFNDSPPYAHAWDIQAGDNPIYPGGSESATQGHLLGTIAPIAGETVYSPGGEVPLGLLKMTTSGGGQMQITLAPGGYNGVAALPMQKVPT